MTDTFSLAHTATPTTEKVCTVILEFHKKFYSETRVNKLKIASFLVKVLFTEQNNINITENVVNLQV